MDISGYKVRSVNPGMVHKSWDYGGWYYSIEVNGFTMKDYILYESPAMCKQAMHEEVARMRKLHLPE